MIEQLADFPSNIVAFVCKGRVTRADYDSILVPEVLKALQAHDKIRLYYETDVDFADIDPGGMWEDFKIGIEHLTRWRRIAVVTDVEWIRHAVRFFSFLMPGTSRLFWRDEAARALDWIVGTD